MEWKPTGVDWQGGGHTGMVKFGEDRNLLVMFYNRSVQIPALSHERPVYRDEIYVKIQQPGETLNVVDRPVKEEDKHRFRQQWGNFIHDRTQVPDGSPIDLLFPNHPSVAENLRAYGVYTIEQCSDLSANAIDSIGRGAQEYVNRAKKYLEMATKGSSFHKLQRELDESNQRNRIMEQQIATMQSQMEKLTIKLTDPVRSSMQPQGFIPNYDVQSERINANSVSNERVAQVKRNRKPTVEDQITNPLGVSEDESLT